MDVARTAAEVAKTEAEAATHATVASLCGLVLRRLNDDEGNPKSGPITYDDLRAIFGEALEQFS